jgi:hypothetical protein
VHAVTGEGGDGGRVLLDDLVELHDLFDHDRRLHAVLVQVCQDRGQADCQHLPSHSDLIGC